jgi:hypothetical protein
MVFWMVGVSFRKNEDDARMLYSLPIVTEKAPQFPVAQQGRSERRSESYFVFYVELLSNARMPLED